MHLAIGTSLATMIITSMVSTISHHRRQAVRWDISKYLIPGVVIGSGSGAYSAHFISSYILAKIFGSFALILTIYFLLPKRPKFHFDQPKKSWLAALGAVVGALSALLGIGGGVVSVPALLGFNLPIKNAVATSASLTFFTALVGSVAYFFIGYHTTYVKDALGYIYLPAFFLMSLGSILWTPLGVKLAHHLPTKALMIIFSICLAITGVSMIFH